MLSKNFKCIRWPKRQSSILKGRKVGNDRSVTGELFKWEGFGSCKPQEGVRRREEVGEGCCLLRAKWNHFLRQRFADLSVHQNHVEDCSNPDCWVNPRVVDPRHCDCWPTDHALRTSALRQQRLFLFKLWVVRVISVQNYSAGRRDILLRCVFL